MDEEFRRNYLDEAVREIVKSPLLRKAEELAKLRGYVTDFTSGELQYDHQTDLFISYRVLRINGDDVKEFDGGSLSAYEALMTKFRRGAWKVQSDALEEFFGDLRRIIELLQSNSFVVRRFETGDETDQCQPLDCLATVKRTWSSRHGEYALVDISRIGSDKPAAISDIIILDGKYYSIIEIG